MKKTARNQLLVVILVLILIQVACGEILNTPFPTQLPTEPPVSSQPGLSTDWLEIYFTDPAAPHASDYEGGPDGVLVRLLTRRASRWMWLPTVSTCGASATP